jgi:hypothetical protein
MRRPPNPAESRRIPLDPRKGHSMRHPRRAATALLSTLALAVPLVAASLPAAALAATPDAGAASATPGASAATPHAASATPGAPAASLLAAEAPAIRINEVESDGGTPGDWIEFINTGATSVDVSGWIVKDDKDDRTDALPAGSVLAPGAVFSFGEPEMTFGLGKADSARLFLADGSTLVDSFSWTSAAPTTYGRCPDGSGDLVVTVSPTRDAPNDCSVDAAASVRINEVESKDGAPGDWIELVNTARVAVDASGLVLKDDDDSHSYALPAGTSIPAGAYLVVEEAQLGFGLGGADAARLFAADGTTLADSYSWTAHAATSYGRCPDASGDFALTRSTTKGAANDCEPPAGAGEVRVNEIESSGGTPGDWVELVNGGGASVDLSGWIVKDSDDTHASTLPAGTTIAAGAYLVIEEAQLGYGLGAADSVRLFAPDGVTVVDSYSWAAHAATSYGRCPDATGDFALTTSVTKGASNDCGLPVRINEVESSDGDLTDWVELKNNGATPVDLAGAVLKDDDDSHALTLPAGSTIAAGGYLAVDLDVAGGFGLGKADSARLFAADGSLVDSFTWAEHAGQTYGRCPDGTGDFAQTTAATKGAVNACAGDLVTLPWPGGASVADADAAGAFGGNMSGLAFEAGSGGSAGAGSGSAGSGAAGSAGDTLWAVKNGPGTLYKLTSSSSVSSSSDAGPWVPVADGGWAAGKPLHYADGSGDVDAEGVAITDAGSAGGVFVSTERNNSVSGTSRPSIIRYDVSGTASALSASREWNLAADLPVVGANAGLEGIAWISDADLEAKGFVDESTGAAYDPAAYPGHGSGLFFVALEGNGSVYAYALDQTSGDFHRVATVVSGFPGVMELEYDTTADVLWAVCDDTCDGRMAALDVVPAGAVPTGAAASAVVAPAAGVAPAAVIAPAAAVAPAAVVAAAPGRFGVLAVVERPAGMPNLNNEGFAIAPNSRCVDGLRPVVWADDSATDGHALRSGTMDCVADPIVDPEPTPSPAPSPTPAPAPQPGGTTPTSPAASGAGSSTRPGGTTPALASTGSEPFGAGLAALLQLAAGAGAFVVRRRATPRRS